MDPEEGMEQMMEEMMCMSNEDCKDTPMSWLAEWVVESSGPGFRCGWIEMGQMGDSMTTDDFCMPA